MIGQAFLEGSRTLLRLLLSNPEILDTHLQVLQLGDHPYGVPWRKQKRPVPTPRNSPPHRA